MTLYTFGNPEAAFIDALTAQKFRFPAGATIGTAFPTAALTAPVIQVAWDGTPTEDERRESATMRVTYWTPKGKKTDAKNGASLARATLLEYVDARLWRVTRGTGRLPGTDASTGNEFCTFTLTAETKPSPVA